MKRIVTLLLAVALIFSLTACTEDVGSDTDVCRGTIKGNTYKSEFSGLTFTKPDSWTFLSDMELANALGMSEELISAEEFAASLQEYPNIPDMAVINNSTGLNMTVGYENLSLTNGTSVSEEEYLETTKQYLETMGNTQFGGSQTVQLSGQDYLKATFTMEIEGTQMETVYYLRLIGDIMTVITVASPAGLIDVDIESLFS